MTILYIILWLLAGFAAVYIGHRWADDRKFDTTVVTALFVTVFGPCSLVAVLVAILDRKFDLGNIFNKTVFKRK